MKFFVDTADLDEIRELNETGLLDGVTTNPSLMAKTGKKIVDVIGQSVRSCRARYRRKLRRPTMRPCSKKAAVWLRSHQTSL